MGETAELYALAWEARRRGTSYGKLVGQLTDYEVREIVKKYKRKKEAEEKSGIKKEASLSLCAAAEAPTPRREPGAYLI